MNLKINITKVMIYCTYILIFLILYPTLKFRISSDTIALINGVNAFFDCLDLNYKKFSLPCDILHFPIFQYLIAIPQKFFLISDQVITKNFIFINIVSSIVSLYFIYQTGLKSSNYLGANISILFFLSGFIICFIDWSFNEATAFMLFCSLSYYLIFSRKMILISIIVVLCSLTKEISYPVIFLFLIIGYIAQFKISLEKAFNFNELLNFIRIYKLPLISILLGLFINSIFNMIRFDSIYNVHNLDPIHHTPNNFIFSYFKILFTSPAAGLLFSWFSLVFIIIFYIFHMICNSAGSIIKDHKFFIMLLSISVIFTTNLMLSKWYSPFGMVAYGPRLTLPYLGGVLVASLYVFLPIFTKKNNKRFFYNLIIFVVIFISSIPNLAFRLNDTYYYDQLNAETKIAKKFDGLLTIQTAPKEVYFPATIEQASRNILISSSFIVLKENKLKFTLWAFSLFLIIYLGNLYIDKKRPS